MTFSYKRSIGALIGNAMQFYDFTIYAFLTPYISREFFNFKNQYISYLVVFSIFAGGYLSRPLGSLLFGYLGDKKGRSYALSKTILISTITTFMIGIIPGYKTVGIVAPLALVFLRLIQGIAVSGEEGGAVVLLFEKFAFKNRGVIGSTVLSSVLIGVIIGSIICTIIGQLISHSLLNNWAWRIPFLLALPFGVIATVLRFYLNDFKLFELAEKHNLIHKKPIRFLFLNYSPMIFYGFCIVSIYSITTSTLIVHLPYFLTVKAGFIHDNSLIILTLAIGLVACLTPVFGKICDKLNPTMIYNASLAGLIIFAPILFYLLSLNNVVAIFSAIAIFSTIIALISSTVFPILVEIFPFSVRYSGVSLSFNLSVTVFSSSTPLVLIFIENNFNNYFAPGIYISLLSTFFIIVIWFLQQKLLIKSFNETQSELLIYQSNPTNF